MYNFPGQTVQKFPIYILFSYCSNYLLLEQPNFVSLPTANSFISDLAYTTHMNPILRSNSNYKTVKMCQYYVLLRANLNYKKDKDAPIPLPYLFPT